MMTGIYGHRLGLYKWEQPWPAEHPSLFRVFSGAGYNVTSFVFDAGHLFRLVPEAGVAGSSQDLDGVIDWLENCRHSDLFLFVHYWGTHFPYLDRPMTIRAWKDMSDRILGAMNESPDSVRPKVRQLYERAVERMSERFLPRLLEAACRHGGRENTLLLVASDHGESWGERLAHGAPLRDVFDLHGNNLFDESIRVPLVLWGPERFGGARIDGIVRTVDIAPTVAELAGLPACGPRDSAGPVDGSSLAPCLVSGKPAPRAAAVAAASADFLDKAEPPRDRDDLWIELALRSKRWKLLWRPAGDGRVVYDLEGDPGERNPLGRGSGEPEEGWRELEEQWARSRCAPAVDPGRRRLEKLGYL